MNKPITAIYENGVLRLLNPLALPEHTQVKIYVHPILPTSEIAAHRRQVHEALTSAGLSLSQPGPPSDLPLLSPARREELARLFGSERPLSDLIDEERDGL
jgi:predicted DNA-binding antitoxin AbrB/MazE fold protein